MKVAALTKFRHGALHEAIKQLGWSVRHLADQSGISYQYALRVYRLEIRPGAGTAEKISLALGAAGLYFDPTAAWPDAFRGFGQSMALEQVADLSPAQLQNIAAPAQLEYEEIPLEKFIAKLPARERWCLDKRRAGLSLDQVGKEMKISRERVRQIEAKAHRLLRKQLFIWQADNSGTDQRPPDDAIEFRRNCPICDKWICACANIGGWKAKAREELIHGPPKPADEPQTEKPNEN